jgi:hypothetical protein
MNDGFKTVLVLGLLGGAFYLAARHGKHFRANPFAGIQPGDAEPSGTGVNFNPAFVSTAASQEPLVTGEPETGNIITGAICASGKKSRPKCAGGCH